MKVVIANPPWPGKGYGIRSNTRWPHKLGAKILVYPVYLGYASSVLKQEGFDVYPIDAVEKEMGIYQFENELKRINPEVIVLEISAPSLNYDLETAQALKHALPNATIVFCGAQATYGHRNLIEDYNFIDICIRGEFEYAAKDICAAISKNRPLSAVGGITFREKGKIVETGARKQIENLDELPFPDREGFSFLDYKRGYYSGKRTALVITSRGCPHQCTFCLWPQVLYGHRLRRRSAKNVVDEIEYLISHYGVDEIDFDDDTITVSKGHIESICNELISRNIKIKWECMGRVDAVDEGTLALMKKAGCDVIFFGFESGSDKILKSIKKNVTKQQIVDAVKLTRKAGIWAAGSFVIGLPEEDRNTIKETINFAKKLGADYVGFDRAAPFPGTGFYETAQKEGLLKLRSIEELDGSFGAIADTRHMARQELDGWIRHAFISYYTSPIVLLRSIARANNAANIRRLSRGFKSVMSRILFWKK